MILASYITGFGRSASRSCVLIDDKVEGATQRALQPHSPATLLTAPPFLQKCQEKREYFVV